MKFGEGMKANHRLIPPRNYRSYREYLEMLGPFPLSKIREDAEWVLTELENSGLKGRGGAGFPTGTKWRTIFSHECPTRYVVCNAAEGEPGTFKDRFLLRKNPYAVLEGILAGFHVVKAKEIYIGIKASFQAEIQILNRAIREMQETGVLKDVPIHLTEGPEEYLFGEEKALLNVIEGEGPFPRTPEEPPYEVGLFAVPGSPNPALVNNVQTFAHVATILRFGAETFHQLGTEDTPGTLIFTLCGDLTKPGIYEVEAGISMQSLLNEHGGGAPRRGTIKAVLPGVSAPVMLPDAFQLPLEFKAMREYGSGLGAAGFIAVADSTSIPRVTESVTRFLYVESCNQCSACKAGLRRASAGLEVLRGRVPDWKMAITEIREAAESAPQGNRCYLPVQAANLIPSLLKHFRKEFMASSVQATLEKDPEWVLPKILDFDESSHRFTYDLHQHFKQPDWTYAEPVPEENR